MTSALLSAHGLKNDRHFFVWFAFRSRKIQVMAFVSFTQSLGTVKYSQLFLVRIKNEIYSCVARLFRLTD